MLVAGCRPPPLATAQRSNPRLLWNVPLNHGLLLGIAVVLGLAILLVPVYFYNRLVTLRNRCRESWSNVDTELKRRYELIPNLVEVVKGYAAHERRVIEEVVALRTQAVANHGTPGEQERDEVPLVRALNRLIAVAEAHPHLRASANYLRLQEELVITEDRIQAARRFYNGNVRDYRDTMRTFPGNVFADLFGFPPEDFFQIDPVEAHPPRVSLQEPA